VIDSFPLRLPPGSGPRGGDRVRRLTGSTVTHSILVVEDDADLRHVLEYSLSQGGYRVETASRGADGLRLARQRPPDLVILDLMLPDVSGLDVCRTLKSEGPTREVPLLMLTAKGEEIDRVVGFELGAEDYVVKPFSVRELMLRIHNILRRTRSEPPAGDVTVSGRLRLDRRAHRAFVDDAEVTLTALEFRALCMLEQRRGAVQTRGTLLQEVWGVSPESDTRTVDMLVKRLREKLGEAAGYIETVRGVGYRFTVTEDDAPR